MAGWTACKPSRGILTCYDFSATPFAPSGKKSTEEALFGWIVSDFGLNDAIESGLVKTPRVVVRDDAVPDATTYKSRLYHIYNDPEVKDDLNRKAEPQEPLPDLVLNAYYLLGYDWRETREHGPARGHAHAAGDDHRRQPHRDGGARQVCLRPRQDSHRRAVRPGAHPAHRLEGAGRGRGAGRDRRRPPRLQPAEEGEEEAAPSRKLTKDEQAELLRQMVDTVGRAGQPGEQVQNVISVGMLSEGWDAKTVTHIMGLRAFSSQLLCEQVVGRGLRRTSYEVNPETGLFEPEYVNIFGVPFTFLPHEGGEDGPPPPPTPKTAG